MSTAKIAVLNGIKKWLAIAPYGTPIQLPSLRHIVAFKTPRTDLRYASERLSQETIAEHYKKEHNMNLRFIIDLTNTDRYYEFKSETEPKCEYYKMSCAGKKLPSNDFLE